MRSSKHTKRVLVLFSSYCKRNKRGKVHATKALARHFYPENSKAGDAEREKFSDRWTGVIETVLYKPTQTVLAKPEYEELFDFIETYISDIEPEIYNAFCLGEFSESLYQVVKGLRLVKPYNKKFPKFVDKDLYAVNTSYFTANPSEIDVDTYIAFHKLSGESEKEGLLKVTYIMFDRSINTKDDQHRTIFQGVIASSHRAYTDIFTGILFDQENQNMLPIIIGQHDAVDVVSNKIISNRIHFRTDSLFLKIYGGQDTFVKVREGGMNPRGTCSYGFIDYDFKKMLDEEKLYEMKAFEFEDYMKNASDKFNLLDK